MSSIELSLWDCDRLDELRPLWLALHAQHREVAPAIGHLPARADAESWARRRQAYSTWLTDPRSMLSVAEAGRSLVGYALATVRPGFAGWATGESMVELESLAVAAEHRGRGIGRLLLDELRRITSEAGKTDIVLTVANANADALRFYERNGFVAGFPILIGPTAIVGVNP